MHSDLGSFIGSANLSLRPGEQIHLMDFIPDQAPAYAVMLLETPGFPGIGHEESRGLSVLACGYYPTIEGKSGDQPRWGWVHLDAESKDMVGQALLKLNAQPGKWFYMLITGGIGHRSVEHVQQILG